MNLWQTTIILGFVLNLLLTACSPTTTVALRTYHGRYVTAMNDEGGRDWVLRAETQELKDWEKFTLLCLDDGRVALQTYHGRYVTAMNDEGRRDWVLRAQTQELKDWEKFTLFNAETGAQLSCSDAIELFKQGGVNIALQTYHGRYVTSMNAEQDWVLRAKTTELKDWEKFIVISLSSTIPLANAIPTMTNTPTPSPTVTSTPKPTPTTIMIPTPSPVSISTAGMEWSTYSDTLGSTISTETIGSVDPRYVLGFLYDLKENGWVGFYKDIAPGILSGTKGIKFSYIGNGAPNTIELKLLYIPDDQGNMAVFSVLWHRATDTTSGTGALKASFDEFACWEDTGCARGKKLDLEKVGRIDFTVSNKPGDTPGTGSIVILNIDTDLSALSN